MFGRIAEEADAVFHSGAHVNFAYPYAALKAANVDGTKEVGRLRVRDHVERLHHVSAIDAMVQKGTRSVRGSSARRWTSARCIWNWST